MLFKGSLSECVDFLARYDSTLWADEFIITHVPAEHCYNTMTVDIYRTLSHTAAAPPFRVVFRGSIVELAHFVLCPPLTAYATRHTLPDLPDNEASDIPPTPSGTIQSRPDQPPPTKWYSFQPPDSDGNDGDHS